MSNPEKPLLISIVGPTAVGKTKVSLELAKRFNGDIISADSRTFYRGLDIGTSKPNLEDRKAVPHHLIDICDPGQTLSLAEFQKAAFWAISSVHERGRLPFLVGGTGQYVKSVVQGWKIPRQAHDPVMRAVLRSWASEIGKQELHKRLAKIDPIAASLIDYRNLRRTIRALEVIFFTGRRFSEQRGKSKPPFNNLIIGLFRPREDLYRRIDERIEAMFDSGWVEEVQTLLTAGYSKNIPALSAIGYQEIIEMLQENLTVEEAKTIISKRTRELVRRQANWFKINDPDIRWFEVMEGVEESISKLIQARLNNYAGARNFVEVCNE